MFVSDAIRNESNLTDRRFRKYETYPYRRQDRERRAGVRNHTDREARRRRCGCRPLGADDRRPARRPRVDSAMVGPQPLTIEAAWFRVPPFGMLVGSISRGNPVRLAQSRWRPNPELRPQL